MTLFQRIKISSGENVGAPAALPVHLVGLADDTLANLPLVFGPATLSQLGLTDTGFLPIPETPPRVLVRKSTVVTRLIAAGLIDAAMAALMSNAAAFGRWTAPDWPEVYADDPDVVALLTAIGADPGEILAAE